MITALTVDGFPLVGTDAAGGIWRVHDLTGWHDGGQMRHDRANKPGQAGAWPSRGFSSSVPITIVGSAQFGDPVSAKLAARAFNAVAGPDLYTMLVRDGASTPDAGVGTLSETPPGSGLFGSTLIEDPPGSGLFSFDAGADGGTVGALTAGVELDGRSVRWVTHLTFAWTLLLTAPDPLRYGPATVGAAGLDAATPGAGLVYPLAFPLDYGVPPGTTPGAVLAPNTGLATYWPTLRVDGPVTDPVITMAETGSTIAYAGTLLAGQWLDIDCAERTVLLNGLVTARKPVTASGDWLGVPVGGGQISWNADDADPDALLTVHGFEGAYI